jgi:hypothetical protein
MALQIAAIPAGSWAPWLQIGVEIDVRNVGCAE